jgi:hypothetical protein
MHVIEVGGLVQQVEASQMRAWPGHLCRDIPCPLQEIGAVLIRNHHVELGRNAFWMHVPVPIAQIRVLENSWEEQVSTSLEK